MVLSPSPDDAVAQLFARAGLPAPEGRDGVRAAAFGPHVLNFQGPDGDGDLRLFLRVADVPADPEARLALYARLLRANAYGLGTGGGQLGVDDRESFVVLSRSFPAAGMAVERLEGIAAALLDLAEEIGLEAQPAMDGPPARAAVPVAPGFVRA